MNNPMPFFYPFNNTQIFNNDELEKLKNRIEQLEKNIQILDSKIKKIEQKNNNNEYLTDEPTDMYII